MFLMTLFSTFFLLTGPMAASSSLDVIRQYHLDTAAGRTAFLTEKLAPYAEAADQRNQEIQALAVEIQHLSPEEEQQRILTLTEVMSQKMGQLLPMLPALNAALTMEEDLQQLDTILQQEGPVSPEQQQILDRLASVCNAVETF